MTIDPLRWRPYLAALLQVDAIRAELGTQTVQEVQAAGTTTLSDAALDELLAAVLEVGKEVLRLEWDCESPAGSGYARLLCCADYFVLDASDDWPDSGPFSNLDEALRCGAFALCLADDCRITSDLDPTITIALAGQLTRDRRQSIRINGRRWRWVHDSLVAPDDDNPDTHARR